MSALASGFPGAEDFYKVTTPTSSDLRKPYVGAIFHQKTDICWLPDRATTTWIITRIQGDVITIQPNVGGPNRAKWQRENRKVPLSTFLTEYKIAPQQRIYP